MIKYEEYDAILSSLQDNLDDPDSVLTFLDVLSRFIKDILATQLSKYSFIRGLDFAEVASQLALDYFLKVKTGTLKVQKWGLYLRKNILRQIENNFSDPRNFPYDNLVKIGDDYDEDNERWEEEVREICDMVRVLFPHLSNREVKILLTLAFEFKLTFYEKVKGLKPKKKFSAIKILFKYLYYLRRRENAMVKTSGETLARALAGVMISPLFLVLDLENMAKVVATLGGQTIRIPSYSELLKIVPLIVILYERNIKGKSIDELSKKFNLEKEDIKIILNILSKVKLSDYEKKNMMIMLSKIVDMVNVQDNFISQRLEEIEEKLRKNSKSMLDLYKSLCKEEFKSLEDILKLTSEITKHIIQEEK